jgi:hypothetical protein
LSSLADGEVCAGAVVGLVPASQTPAAGYRAGMQLQVHRGRSVCGADALLTYNGHCSPAAHLDWELLTCSGNRQQQLPQLTGLKRSKITSHHT